MIYQQEGTEAGASGDDLGAPFSLPVLSKSALTHHPQASGGTACGSRALDQGDPPSVPSLPSMDRPADANGGLCIGRSFTDAPGAWGSFFGHQQAVPGIYRCIACYYYLNL